MFLHTSGVLKALHYLSKHIILNIFLFYISNPDINNNPSYFTNWIPRWTFPFQGNL